MKKIILLLFLYNSVISAHSQTTILDSILYTGVWHYYRAYIPASHDCSVIIHLHGYGSSGATEQIFTNYMPVADAAGFIVAYPDGLKDSTGNQYWNIGWSIFPNTDDVGYLSVFVDTLIRRYSINPQRVFASGFSVGGFMCQKLACELSNKIAAIANIAGSIVTGEANTCTPARAVPVMEIHGTSDNTVPYTGTTNASSGSLNIDTLVKFYVNIDQCNPIPVHTVLPHNPNTTNGTTVDHYVYTGGLQASSVELYKINGGQHVDWPGNCSGCSNDFNASQQIWRFFNNYRPANCTLPITLTSFCGTSDKEGIELKWRTENELNNKYFEIQRSTDAFNFRTIGSIIAHGLNGLNEQYNFTDVQPLAGINFYRLKQVDDDGHFTFSNIIKFNFKTNNLVYSLYPNPASGSLNITLPAAGTPSTITLYSMQGKILMQKILTSNTTTVTLNISNLSKGMYQVTCQQNNQNQIWKLVKL